MTKYIFVTGGVVSGLGKGITAASLGRLLKSARPQGRSAEARPVYQRRSRHDEPVSARRGLCHRRRRGDRSRPGPLRALHRRGPQRSAANVTTGKRLLDTCHQPASARANIWARPIQVIPHITDEIKRRIYVASARGRRRTWSSPRSAAPSATSSLSRSSRPSAR